MPALLYPTRRGFARPGPQTRLAYPKAVAPDPTSTRLPEAALLPDPNPARLLKAVPPGPPTRVRQSGAAPPDPHRDLSTTNLATIPPRTLRRIHHLQIRGERTADLDPRATALQCGVTQARVAELMGISQARVSQIEHGKITSMDLVRDYIVALGGTLDVVAHVGDWSVKVA